MFGAVRQRLLASAFGGGLTGTVLAGSLKWLGQQVGVAWKREPERLDTSSLVPGETYIVTTRPAPNRTERKARAAAAKVSARLDRELRPTRARRRVAAKLAKVDRCLAKATAGSRRERSLVEARQGLARSLEELSKPSRRARSLKRKLDQLERVARRERDDALAKASKKSRPPLERTFT